MLNGKIEIRPIIIVEKFVVVLLALLLNARFKEREKLFLQLLVDEVMSVKKVEDLALDARQLELQRILEPLRNGMGHYSLDQRLIDGH